MADTYGANVSLLLHCNGTNGSTTFTDSSFAKRSPATKAGNVSLSTAQKKFGTASIYFDGTGDYIGYAGESAFAFGTGDFTVEMWVYLLSGSLYGLYGLFTTREYGDYSDDYQTIAIGEHGDTNVDFEQNTIKINGDIAIGLNTWAHVAICRSGTSTRLFINGVQDGDTYTDTSNYLIGTNKPSIGAIVGPESDNQFVHKGYLDEIRITKGIARYTSNFTAPTAAFDDPVKGIIGAINISIIPNAVTHKRLKAAFVGASAINVIPAAELLVNFNKKMWGLVPVTVTPHSLTHKLLKCAITGAVSVTVTPSSTLRKADMRSIIGAVSVTVTPQSLTHKLLKCAITGAVSVTVTPSSTLRKADVRSIVGATTIGLTGNAVMYKTNCGRLVIPTLYAYGTGYSELPNSAALVIPGLIGTGVGGGIASGTLPSLLITATGTQELHGSAEAILPGLYFEGTGQREYNGTATLVVPGFNASSYGAATAECVLPSFTVSGTGTQEFGGKANCILPGLIIAATGQREYNGTAALILPGLRGGDIARAALVMPGLFVSASGGVGFANSVGYVLNVHSSESYQWSNMNFLHIIRVGTDFYGVKSNGLYKISTAYDTDAGTPINANILTKSTDFGSYKVKRLQYAYLGSDTSTTIQPIVDGVTKQSHVSSFGGRKTLMSKGNHGRYFQLRISNIQELTGLELLPQELQRRVK